MRSFAHWRNQVIEFVKAAYGQNDVRILGASGHKHIGDNYKVEAGDKLLGNFVEIGVLIYEIMFGHPKRPDGVGLVTQYRLIHI